MSDSLLSTGDADVSAEEATQEQSQERDFVTAEDQEPPRPEWLPEKYKSPEDLAKAYKELESKIGAKESDLRSKIVEELQAEAFSERPESKGDYQLPEYVDEDLSVDSDLLSWWAEHAFENGFSQAEFEQGIEMYAKASQGMQPDLEAETKKLGENAQARIEAASVFITKHVPQEALPAIERMFETHEGVLAVEAIMEAMKDGSFSAESSAPSGISEASLREMMQDERYWNPAKRDANYIKQVQEGFSRLYG